MLLIEKVFAEAEGEGVVTMDGMKHVRRDRLIGLLVGMGLTRRKAMRAIKLAVLAEDLGSSEEYGKEFKGVYYLVEK